MDTQKIAAYTGLDSKVIQRFMTMSAQNIYADADYLAALQSLDKHYLKDTLPAARKAYEAHLGEFNDAIHERYGLTTDLMSAFTLGNWVVGILEYPAEARKLVEMHNHVPTGAILDNLPGILDILNEMPQGTREWQKALCLLAFPLMGR